MSERYPSFELTATLGSVLARSGFALAPVAAFAIGLAAVTLDGLTVPLLVWAVLGLSAVLCVTVVLRASRIGMRLDANGLQIRNLYRTVNISWDGAEQLAWRERLGQLVVFHRGARRRLHVLRRGGRPVPVDAASGLGRRRRRELRVELDRQMAIYLRDANVAPPRPVADDAQAQTFAPYVG